MIRSVGFRRLPFGARRVSVAGLEAIHLALVGLDDVTFRQPGFMEYLLCPGGCVRSAGQPATIGAGQGECCARALRNPDTFLDFHRPQENPEVDRLCLEMGSRGNSITRRELQLTLYTLWRRHWSISAPACDTAMWWFG